MDGPLVGSSTGGAPGTHEGTPISLAGTLTAPRTLAIRVVSFAAAPENVQGTIKLSGTEQYHEASEPGERRGTEMFGKRVTYTYRYQNVSYTNECARVAAGTRR